MKKIITLSLISCVFFSAVSFASKLVQFDIKELEEKSSFIVIGKINDMSLGNKESDRGTNYNITVKTISYLKGSSNAKTFTLSLWRGGLKGFDVIPGKDMFYVFFLKKLDKAKGELVYPGAISEFRKYYFKE